MSNLHQDNIEREDQFLRELGHALVEWRRVEAQVYGLFLALMRGANQTLVSVTLHHIQSFESRLQLLDRCMFFLAKDGEKKDWKVLSKRVDALCAIRNQLIHAAVIIEGKGDGRQVHVIQPSFFDATALVRKRAMNPHYRHDTDRIQKHAYDFGKLARDMRAFREGATLRIASKAAIAPARKSSSSKSKGRSA